ncbi:hypothetical protein P3L51_03490 [Streptomyces sp. PSRA5]
MASHIGELPPRKRKSPLSDEKNHTTHIFDGFVFLGFHGADRVRNDTS